MDPAAPSADVNFRTPPVVETAVGVEFAPIEGWGIGHFGLFWDRIRSTFPTHQAVPRLPSQIERFGPAKQPIQLPFEIGDIGHVRCWFIHKNDTRLLQVQSNRFILNWRKTATGTEYPSYENLRAEFESQWLGFVHFLRDVQLPNPRVIQCELTYVNHVPKGARWENFGDLKGVTSAFAGLPTTQLGQPESASIAVNFVIPNNRGRLYVALQPAVRNADGAEVLQFNITVRGGPASPDMKDALAWFELGHLWAVQAFLEFTTAEMHKAWGRTK